MPYKWRVCSDFRGYLARPAGFEPATLGLEVRRSIRLSYGRARRRKKEVERETGLEPATFSLEG